MKKTLLIASVCSLFGMTLSYSAPTSDFEMPEMVKVEAGTFQMGATKEQSPYSKSDESPVTSITLSDFYMGKYEVTNDQFAFFLTEEGNHKEGGGFWYTINKQSLIEQHREGIFASKNGFANFPVNNVSWYGAVAYTEWLSSRTKMPFRLPTEAEWEYASRGGLRGKGFIYGGSDRIEDVAWVADYSANSGTGWGFKKDKGTHPVGQKISNELGIFDMSGNLSEWVADLYENYPPTDAVNPKGPAFGSLRVQRGGSWDSNLASSRNSARNFEGPVSVFSANDGFRVAMDAGSVSADMVRRFAQEHAFNGTILVSRRGQIIYLESFGFSDIEKKTPLQNETQYPIASITKLFTSTLVLLLAEEGKLDIQETISRYLPNYSGEGSHQITLHHLLTHTSGLGDPEAIRTDDAILPDMYIKKHTIDELIENYCSGPLRSRPGTEFYYNNGDYIILGGIIEAVTGKPYEAVLKERILNPLDMNMSGVVGSSESAPEIAQGYKWNAKSETFQQDPPRSFSNYAAAGAMYSTATDLATFAHAIFSGPLLGDASLELLLRAYPETQSYGYGLWIQYPQYGRQIPKVAQRFGRIWGINTLVSQFLEEEITLVVLSNTDKIGVSRVQEVVAQGLFGVDLE